MSDHQIVVSGALPRPEIELAASAFNARGQALKKAEAIGEITGIVDLDAAAEALTFIKAIMKSVEESRKVVKGPILDIGKRIDAAAKDFLDPLENQAIRLSHLVGSYQEAAKRAADKERREEEDRQQKILKEMQEKQREAIAQGNAGAANEARAEAAEKLAESQLKVISAEGPKLSGVASKTSWKFSVDDIHALFHARPDLCLIEPNNAAIRAILKGNAGKPIPGLRIWQEAGAIVRTAPAIKPEQFDY